MSRGENRDNGILEAFRQAGAEVRELRGNQPLRFDAETSVWLVESGRVEVFAVGTTGEERAVDGPRIHLTTISAGTLMFGIGSLGPGDSGPRDLVGFEDPRSESAPPDSKVALLGFGSLDTRLHRLPLSAIMALARDGQHLEALVAGVDHWLTVLFQKVTRTAAPNRFQSLRPGLEVELGDEEPCGRTDGDVVWVQHLSGQSLFLGRKELGLEPAGHVLPISGETWIVGTEPTALSCVATVHLLKSGRLWASLGHFHRLFLDYVALELESSRDTDRQRLEQRLELDRRAVDGASRRLAGVLSGGDENLTVAPMPQQADALLLVAREVGERLGLELQAPPEGRIGGHHGQYLERLCAASQVRSRQVILWEDWWRHDNGPLIAFRAGEGEGGQRLRGDPVAVLPITPERYELFDPTLGQRIPVDASVAATLEGEAFMLYPSLPARPVRATDLVRLALRGQRHDLRSLVVMGIGIGLLGLLMPILTGHLIAQVIPSADRSQLLPMVLALVAAALAATAFSVVRGIAVLRLSGKLDGAVQSAIWSRLLDLPAVFFRRFSVGDLVQRSMGIDAIRDLVVGRVATSLLDAVFSVFSFALLFYYSARLALLATALTLVLISVTTLLVYLQVRYQRQLLAVQGRLASMLFGLLNGLPKLRIAGAEARSYALWAEHFGQERRWTLRAQRLANLQAAFNAFWGLTTLLILFAVMGLSQDLNLEVSSFLAFNAAFGQFQAAAMSLISVFSSALLIAPLYERLQPILETAPEVDEAKAPAGELIGDIELSHVSFRYQAEGPLILNDVSIRAKPGQMVAIVGSSGSGKSTCLRLLLGFEEPTAGSIYFDGQDLPSLAVHSVRRQMGVVLQNSKPIAGDIFRNIVGTTNLGLADAWEAARKVGLAEDIEAMPMGMHTVIGEGASTFSGGQQQRLLIARAIANRPRILIFDEATSALDNRTQDIVSKSLEGLRATRLVVAHRLSTIRNADVIYMLEGGRVVEVGTYEELMAREGAFARLAARQLA